MNRKENTKFINIDELNNKNIIDKIENIVIYPPEDYGISAKFTGSGTKILIIDSGRPTHQDIVSKEDCYDFSGDNNIEDTTGHSTIVSGLIAAKNKKSMIGLAPNSKLYFAKVVNEKGNCDYNSIIAAILWGIVKKVDIIVMALGSQYDYQILHDAIIKAYSSGICLFAATGNHIKKENDKINYPSRYPEVYSVGRLTKSEKINNIILEKVDFAMKNSLVISTFLGNKYIKTSGSSVSTALVSGLASLLIEKNKDKKNKITPQEIYSDLQKIIK